MPAAFKQNWVILLEDSTRGRPILWRGSELPFLSVSASIPVPPSGVVRVVSLGRLLVDGNVRATWSDGAVLIGSVSGHAPAASGASAFVAYQREQHGSGYDPRDEVPVQDEVRFASYLKASEQAVAP